jgi:hypothetical protein
MIVGISGKKQHGKDTVAKMIQYLAFNPKRNSEFTLENFLKQSYGYRKISSGWKTKSFAGKLKQIVALLIGCTIEQLEDNDFKEKPLGEEWRVYRLYKNFTYYLIDKETYDKMENMNGYDTLVLTPRLLLQLIGTECGRQIIHPNIWVNALMSDYYCPYCGFVDSGPDNSNECYKGKDHELPNWIITDVRFPNEAEAIKQRGGVVIRINNPRIESTDKHLSETSLDSYKGFDATITNSGDLDKLLYEVNLIICAKKLLPCH